MRNNEDWREYVVEGIYYFIPDADKGFIKVADQLLKCSRTGDFDFKCPYCQSLRKCLKVFTRMSYKSSLAALKPAEVKYYTRWFKAIAQGRTI